MNTGITELSRSSQSTQSYLGAISLHDGGSELHLPRLLTIRHHHRRLRPRRLPLRFDNPHPTSCTFPDSRHFASISQ
ncbi:hypothetical protein MLD38_036737 [Melastoma candidum]|uniref:Uncharacterized protein n=1 Tax=Melastoma candidum TaxID=119954 RepID=A0ACB9LLK8_9MYRT|nr:hypothetical protein MLD38_036737 [Melastoma candidum]